MELEKSRQREAQLQIDIKFLLAQQKQMQRDAATAQQGSHDQRALAEAHELNRLLSDRLDELEEQLLHAQRNPSSHDASLDDAPSLAGELAQCVWAWAVLPVSLECLFL